jgi:hypothetical protein
MGSCFPNLRTSRLHAPATLPLGKEPPIPTGCATDAVWTTWILLTNYFWIIQLYCYSVRWATMRHLLWIIGMISVCSSIFLCFWSHLTFWRNTQSPSSRSKNKLVYGWLILRPCKCMRTCSSVTLVVLEQTTWHYMSKQILVSICTYMTP